MITRIFNPRLALSILINATIIILGVSLVPYISIQEYPHNPQQSIVVNLSMPGSIPELFESEVIIPLEKSILNTPGITGVASHINEERCIMHIKYGEHDTAQSANNKISSILRSFNFPPGMRHPTVTDSTESVAPLCYIIIDYDKSSDIGDVYADELITQLSALPGISSIMRQDDSSSDDIHRKHTLHICMDPIRMASYGISPLELMHTISANNIREATGSVQYDQYNYKISFKNDLSLVSEYENIVVKTINDKAICVRDIAEVYIANTNIEKVSFNGKTAQILRVYKQNDSHPLDVSHTLQSKIEEINSNAKSSGINLSVILDSSDYIHSSCSTLVRAIIEALALVALTIIFFLQSIKAVVIPLLSLPICLVSSFIFIYFFKCSINFVTLLALVMATGLVVDDAIVCVEAIEHSTRTGSNKQNIISAMESIELPVLAMTLIMVAIFAPLCIVGGNIGVVFKEFALCLSGMMLVSYISCITLVPHFYIQALSFGDVDIPYKRYLSKCIELLRDKYSRYLNMLKFRGAFVLGGASIMLTAMLLFVSVASFNTDPFLHHDKGYINVTIHTQGSSLTNLYPIINQCEGHIYAIQGVKSVATIAHPSQIMFVISLDDIKQRNDSEVIGLQIKDALSPYIYNMPISISKTHSEFDYNSNYISILIQSNNSYDDFAKDMPKLNNALKGKEFTMIELSPSASYALHINQEIASLYNLNPKMIADNIAVITKGNPPATLRHDKLNNLQYPVRVWGASDIRNNLDKILQFHIRGHLVDELGRARETYIPLSEVVSFTEKQTRSFITREDGLRSVRIKFASSSKVDKLQFCKSVVPAIKAALGPQYTVTADHSVQKSVDERSASIKTVLISILTLFCILAIYFNNFIMPLLVMLAIPLTVVSTLFTMKAIQSVLQIVGYSPHYYSLFSHISLFFYVALIAIIGMVSKNTILIIDSFVNHDYKSNPINAIILACERRFLPIVMTTSAMLLGVLPLCWIDNLGYEVYIQVGSVISVGLLCGIVITLFLLPAILLFIYTPQNSVEEIIISDSTQ